MRHAFNIETHLVMGVTDVDDKIIKRSSERKENGRPVTNVEFLKLARSYENDFFADLDLLGVLRPTAVARVSEHIEEIVDYIRTICDNGHGYEADDGVYFDCDSLRVAGHGSYGALARSAADVSSASSPLTTPGWDSPWGFGRPGWHIECSAMTHTLMGPHLDIHSGGIDLKFPHHNNEVAQCQAHNKCQAHEWTNQFVHFGHLHIE
jgi:cysteinyl-tRNA synthetase